MCTLSTIQCDLNPIPCKLKGRAGVANEVGSWDECRGFPGWKGGRAKQGHEKITMEISWKGHSFQHIPFFLFLLCFCIPACLFRLLWRKWASGRPASVGAQGDGDEAPLKSDEQGGLANGCWCGAVQVRDCSYLLTPNRPLWMRPEAYPTSTIVGAGYEQPV